MPPHPFDRTAAHEVSGLELSLHRVPYIEADRIHASSLDVLFDRYPHGVVLLWVTTPIGQKPMGGHWTFIAKTGHKRLLYLDSYGIPVGSEPDYGARRSNLINAETLSGWTVDQLVDQPLGCQLQAFSPSLVNNQIINTCGRYVLLMALYVRGELAAGRVPTIAGYIRHFKFKCVPGDDSRSTESGNDARAVELTNPMLFP